MKKIVKHLATVVSATFLLLAAPSSYGILIDGDGPEYQTRPTNAEEANLWDHFCYKTNEVGGSVYIGNVGNRFPRGMVLTARHLGLPPAASIWQCMNGAPVFSADVVNGVPVVVRPCFWMLGNATQPPACQYFEPIYTPPELVHLNPNGTGDIDVFSPTSDPWAADNPATRDLAVRTTTQITPDPAFLIGNDEAFLIGNGHEAFEIVPGPPGERCYSVSGTNERHWARNTFRNGPSLTNILTNPQSGQGVGRFGDSGSPIWARSSAGPWELMGTAFGGGHVCFAPVSGFPYSGGSGTELYKIARQLKGRANDSDNDGIDDYLDNCPMVLNPNQENINKFSSDQVIGTDHLEFSWADWNTGVQNRFDGMYPPVAGNVCDADFNESNLVTIADFVTFKQCMGKPVPYEDSENAPLGPAADPVCAESNFDDSPVVTIGDFATFRKLIGMSGNGLPCTTEGCPF